ncbi:MAG TPA: hypothetical protein VHB48_09395 [Chitinophagaceae bacterium]|jgi:hypothetical protein|nr:hypothetical protein [Chitinophagaceae bacterium]
MSDNWNLIRAEVHAFRDYVHKLPPAAKAKAHYCYLLKKEEFKRLMDLKSDGTELDGVRIYLGAEMIDGHMVPTIHVIPVEKEGEQYNDYGVPPAAPAAKASSTDSAVKVMAFSATATSTDSGGGGSTTGGTYPCPNFCSGQNILNS